ncbi:MAG: pyridoxal phosphate-dependent aminotransferase family protein [Maribacter sp.]|uniref:pyridoxal phosphate-dependent aminotransferase family protein n=1 Tax=Maribacter sp. TaxID=1897614 RepID=UPI003C72DE9C
MAYYIDGFPGREIFVEGKKYLYFGGTSYLGLQTDAEFKDHFIRNVRKYGTNYGASRKSNVRLTIYERAESLLAHIAGCPAALTLSSGYLAGQFVAQNFNSPEYKLFYAPNTHSALYNKYNKPFSTFSELNQAIRDHLKHDAKIIPVVFMDSIDFIGNNYPGFKGLKNLPLDRIILIVDDSHGIGIIGNNGEGVYKTLQKSHVKELIVCCSLGKGFGIQAGAVLGSHKRMEQLGGTAFFGGASPAAPSVMATFIDAQHIYGSKRVKLGYNMDYFEKSVKHIDFFNRIREHPTYSFKSPQLADSLDKNGFILTNFNYPDESSEVMSRIVLSSHHTESDIDALSDCLDSFI